MADQSNEMLAYSVVWSPLPPITWILPFIGHTGIADSRGVVSDFQGPYTVGDSGRMAFGAPTRYVPLQSLIGDKLITDGECSAENGQDEATTRFNHNQATTWDEAIQQANQVYRGRMHNLFCENCHSHVAHALNQLKDSGGKWDMVRLCWVITVKGRFVSWTAIAQTYGPFLILVLIVWMVRRV